MAMPHALYPDSLISKVIAEVRAGKTVVSVCGKPGFPSQRTFFRRVDEHPELAREYAEALQQRSANKEQ
jgi:hypothetical protein